MKIIRVWRVIFSIVLTASLVLSMGPVSTVKATSARSVTNQGVTPQSARITTKAPVKVDRSPVLRTVATSPRNPSDRKQVIPLGQLLKQGSDLPYGAQPGNAAQLDQALQNVRMSGSMPAPLMQFEGINNISGVAPPDTNGDIGLNHYVQWVNLYLQMWEIDRAKGTATSVVGPVPGNILWQGFGGPCESINDGDPIVLYDELSDRWFLSQFAVSGVNYQCIAVSQTGDPTGAWYRYAYDWGAKMNDYPKFGVWPDAYYMTVNQFDSNSDWAGAGIAAFDRSQMLLGLPAMMLWADLYGINDMFGGMLPADLDGMPPPLGTPNYFAEVDNGTAADGGDEMRIWEFKVNWAEPMTSTFGLPSNFGQPNYILPVDNFTMVCATTRDCVPQKGVTQKLDAIGDRLMFRLAYRYFPGEAPYESLVVNHTVDVGTSGARAGVRWYEVRKTNNTFAIAQQGSFGGANPATDTTHRWMGSIAQDWQGNMALGYSLSSADMYPSIGYAGRLSTDPAGTLPLTEQVFFTGPASQSGVNRWGDYSSMSVDPVDGCTFWYTNEYSTGSWSWATRVAAFKLPSCTPQQYGTITGVVKDLQGNLLDGAYVTAGAFSQTTGADGRYTFNLVPGDYQVVAVAAGYAPQMSPVLAVTVGSTTTYDFTLTPYPPVTLNVTVTDGSGKGWPLYAAIKVTAPLQTPKVVYTNPATGKASLKLSQETDYLVSVSAPGYITDERSVHYTTATASEAFKLLIQPSDQCPTGYGASILLSEGFEGGVVPPPGWNTYQLQDPNDGFQIADGGYAGSHSAVHGYADVANQIIDFLVTPQIAVETNTVLTFADLSIDPQYAYAHGIAVSTDADPSNTNAYKLVTWLPIAQDEQWHGEFVDLSAYAGQKVHLALVYVGDNADIWFTDEISALTCKPVNGARVSGYVKDANTGLPLNGAVITNPLGVTISYATPDDPALGDGYYQSFAPTAQPVVSASAPKYKTVQATLTVGTQVDIARNFDLPAGQLTLPAPEVTFNVYGTTSDRTLTLKNTGGNTMVVSALEANIATLPSMNTTPTGPFAPAHRHVGPKNKNKASLEGVVTYMAPVPGPMSADKPATSWDTALAFPWGIGLNTDAENLWLSNPSGGSPNLGDDMDYQFTMLGLKTGNKIDVRSWMAAFAADMAYNPVTKMMWQVNVGGDNCIYELDQANKTSTGNKICPPFPTSQRGLAYDPLSDTFFSGSWNDGVINHFNTDGVILDSVDVGLDISGLAFNPVSRHLFAATNGVANTDIFVLDAAKQYAVVDSFQVSGATGAKQGLDIDCTGKLWLVSSPKVFVTGAIEPNVCSWKDIPWLTVNPTSRTINGKSSQNVTLTFDPKNMKPGTYSAYLMMKDNTPYKQQALKVTMVVSYPKIYLPIVGKGN